jgi:hypothetical protein
MTCFPFLTREVALEMPALVERYYKAFLPPTGGIGAVYSLLEDRIVREDGDMKTTAEVQVWLLCRERFRVRDMTTGLVVQGTPDYEEKLVTHIVRLETTLRQTINDAADMTASVDNWRIADIDDLVHHKTWYHV